MRTGAEKLSLPFAACRSLPTNRLHTLDHTSYSTDSKVFHGPRVQGSRLCRVQLPTQQLSHESPSCPPRSRSCTFASNPYTSRSQPMNLTVISTDGLFASRAKYAKAFHKTSFARCNVSTAPPCCRDNWIIDNRLKLALCACQGYNHVKSYYDEKHIKQRSTWEQRLHLLNRQSVMRLV